jgi:hypothetical protein
MLLAGQDRIDHRALNKRRWEKESFEPGKFA